ncbi:hypothetical protein [Leucobacter coleopterorum]|uniref:hypothetical protein n=1 Tax=Leucobacter coleopterorum TaxID=2714933 RepID=UPI00198210C4|nr:hypothetical protein [Leucobacter coleopterorum]
MSRAAAVLRDVSTSALGAGFLSALINFAGPFLIVLEATRAAGLASITTLAVTMSGVVTLSVGAASWGLLAGNAVYLVLAPSKKQAQQPSLRKEATVPA